MVYTHFLVCGGNFFPVSLKRKNTRESSFYHCFTILRSRKCGVIYTRFHTFMLSANMIFMWWIITGELKFFHKSCGTMIWVRIIPVKVDRSLTGIIRTYIIIIVHTNFELASVNFESLRNHHSQYRHS